MGIRQQIEEMKMGELGVCLTDDEVMSLMTAANSILLLLRRAAQLRPEAAPYGYYALRAPRHGMRASRPQLPVPIGDSVAHEYIVCLEDGARVKSLRSYLRRFNMTPDQYRQRWGLPKSYPMVAPALSEMRSAIALRIKPHLKRARNS